MFILSNTFPGCHVSASIVDPAYLQVLLLDFQLVWQDDALDSSSQHLLSDLFGCFLLQCLHTGASLNLFSLSCRFVFFSSVPLLALVGFLLSVLTNVIISFIASVMLWITASIWCMRFSASALISSSVASACSSIAFALNCFAVSLFCLFSFAYSVEIQVFDVNPCLVRCRFCFPFTDGGIKFAGCLEIK